MLSSLHNFVCAEVCLTNRIKSVEDGVEWLKWTYLYRRLRRNPSFYECDGSDEKTISAFLETLSRKVLLDLDEAGVVELDGDSVTSATLGSVAAYYYLDYRTTSEASINVDDFEAAVVDATQRRREALAVAFLCAAREFDELPVRHNEDIENSQLASQLLDDDAETIQGLLELGYDSPHAKAQLLIHAKLRDGKLPIADYATDQRSVLEQAPRVLAALIDVAGDAGCVHATLALLELSQAIRSKCSREALPRGRTKLTAKTVADVEAGGEFSVEVTLGSNGRGPRAFYLVLSDDDELVALKKVIVGGAKCEASLAVEAPDEACEWSLALRAVFDGARGFDAAVELPAITVVGKALDAGAAEFVPGS